MPIRTLFVAARYAPCRSEDGAWSVVDEERAGRTVIACSDAGHAALIAGLMNGDLSALARATPEMAARCRAALGDALAGFGSARRPPGRFSDRGARPAPSVGPVAGTFH